MLLIRASGTAAIVFAWAKTHKRPALLGLTNQGEHVAAEPIEACHHNFVTETQEFEHSNQFGPTVATGARYLFRPNDAAALGLRFRKLNAEVLIKRADACVTDAAISPSTFRSEASHITSSRRQPGVYGPGVRCNGSTLNRPGSLVQAEDLLAAFLSIAPEGGDRGRLAGFSF